MFLSLSLMFGSEVRASLAQAAADVK